MVSTRPSLIGFENDAPDYYDEGGLGWQLPHPKCGCYHHCSPVQRIAVASRLCSLHCNETVSLPRSKAGRTVWHIIPESSVDDFERYVTNIDDERRLFYVALTRAKKFLYCTFGPGESRLYQQPSVFLDEIHHLAQVCLEEPPREWPESLPSVSKVEVPTVRLSFSEWKYFSQCPYMFKLRFLYGFNEPLAEALGYGKSLHDALAEIHRLAINGVTVKPSDLGAYSRQTLSIFPMPTPA